jgi:hypothetical protein
VRDHAVSDLELADRDLPLVGGRLQQHHARGGAAATHVILRAANAAAAAGRHVAPHALAGQIALRGDRLDGDLVPVALQLFGDELGEAGMRPLPHFVARDADHAAVVGLDHHPRVDLGRGALGSRAHIERQVEAEGETATGGGGADDECAARKLRGLPAERLCHGRPPLAQSFVVPSAWPKVGFAAMCTAARMR